MKKFRVEWWEERIYRCEITVEAEDDYEAEKIALESDCEDENGKVIRDWTVGERSTYFEDLKDSTDSGIVRTEEV